jgi:hemolysin III
MTNQTLLEEIINSSLHFIGLGLSIAGLVILLILSENAWETVSFSIYGSALIFLYLASTLYHSVPSINKNKEASKLKYYLKLIDHSAIFILIAGSYTPFVLTALRGAWGWSIFGVVWGLALFGIIFKAVFKDKFMILSTIIYILMGWLILIAVKPLMNSISTASLILLFSGGIVYTLGVYFFAKSKGYYHNVWHLFVLGGSILHFFSVLYI